MPILFPGMDPYLERPGLWEEVHTRLIVAIADALGPQLRPHYRVSVERRTYLAVLTLDGYHYDRAGYDLVVDYGQPPEPPLAKGDMAWVIELLRQHHLS